MFTNSQIALLFSVADNLGYGSDVDYGFREFCGISRQQKLVFCQVSIVKWEEKF